MYTYIPKPKYTGGALAPNMIFARLKILARQTRCQSLIDQVDALEDADRHSMAIAMGPVARAAKGEIDPETLNLQSIIEGNT